MGASRMLILLSGMQVVTAYGWDIARGSATGCKADFLAGQSAQSVRPITDRQEDLVRLAHKIIFPANARWIWFVPDRKIVLYLL